MKLTERQRWDVIRAMVKQKNDEYSAFLLRFFDPKQMSQIIGITRNTFWEKCKNGERNPKVCYDDKDIKHSSSWLDELSCEDLLIFLDYRCKMLQQLYKYYKCNRTIEIGLIKNLAQDTAISDLIKFNDGYLMKTGKPARLKDEVKTKDLDLGENKLKDIALAQSLGVLASTYSMNMNCHISKGMGLAQNLQTYNATPDGYITGHRLEGEILNCNPLVINKIKFETGERQTIDDNKIRLQGFDKDKNPVFMLNGKYVDIFSKPIPHVTIVYDTNRQKIEDEVDIKTARHQGFDSEGRPVYYYDGEYYNSIGQAVEEDSILPNYEDDFSF